MLPAMLLAGGFFEGGAAEDRFAGGWRWQAAVVPLAEGVIATCVSLWAIGLFRRRLEIQNAVARDLVEHVVEKPDAAGAGARAGGALARAHQGLGRAGGFRLGREDVEADIGDFGRKPLRILDRRTTGRGRAGCAGRWS